jgi:hypothetical protein
MAFMAGDSKRGVPQFVEVEWMVATPGYERSWEGLKKREDKYSKLWMKDVDEVNAQAPHYYRRIDLIPFLTPELIAFVRANRSNTHLKLVVVFKDDNVSISAESEVWRK